MWFVSIFLYLMFAFNPPVYQQMKANGASCMAYYNWDIPTTPQPVCPFDPSNTNPFIP
jgi:hypothetical protein